MFIAVSKTNDAAGGWWTFAFDVDWNNDNDLWDFPQLGMDFDSILITANVFNSASAYESSDIIAIPKGLAYNGQGFAVPILLAGTPGTIAPPIVMDRNPKSFFLAAPTSGSALRLFDLRETSRNVPALNSVEVTVPSYSAPPDAEQFQTAQKIDTLDSRFVNAHTQVGDSIWQVHTIANGSVSLLKWYKINTQTAAVEEQDTITQGSNTFAFNASVAASLNGDTYFSYSSTSPFAFAMPVDTRFTGKLAGETFVNAGASAFLSNTWYSMGDTPERWGYYSAVSIDPAAPNRAWMVNLKANNAHGWATWIYKVGMP